MAESEPNPVATQDGLWKAECARRTLLSHLGITPLVSRFDPVAAKPAQRLGVPTGFNDVTSMDDPATSSSDDEMRAAKLRERLRGDANEGASAEEADAIPRAPAEEAGDAAADRSEPPAASWRDVTSDTPFSLLFVTSDDILWVEAVSYTHLTLPTSDLV